MDLILGSVYVLMVLLAAHFLGRVCLAKVGGFAFESDRLIAFAFRSGLGYLFISFVIFALVATSLVSVPVLWGCVALLSVISLREIFFLFKTPPLKFDLKQFNKMDLAILCFLALLYLFLMMITLLPLTSIDAMTYHLEVPKTILETKGDYSVFKDNFYAFFPQFGEMLLLLAYGTFGVSAARLQHTLFLGLLSMLIYAFVRKESGRREGLLAVLIFCTVPSAMLVASWAYVDMLLAFYFFAAYILMSEFLETKSLKVALLWGLFTGVMVATKYTGLQITILFLIAALATLLKRKDYAWTTMCRVAVFFTVSLMVGAPYFIRNWIVTGWPLFPFKVLGFPLKEHMNWDPERTNYLLGWLGSFGAPLETAGVLSTIAAPVMVFIRSRFDEPAYFEGIAGPIFLLVPLLILLRLKLKRVPLSPRMAFAIFFSGLYIFFWAMTTKQVRFFMPIFPLFCYLLATNLSILRSKLLNGAVVLLIFLNCFMGVREISHRRPLDFLLGRETREQYLAKQLPRYYEIYQEANKLLKPGDRVYLMNMKNYVYYLDVDWRSDFIFERYSFDRALEVEPNEAGVRKYFESRGITHLMVDEAFIGSPDWGLEPEALGALQAFMMKSGKLLARREALALYSIT